MRYSKGSLVLNPRRDLPILSRVVSARFIAHSQLFEFLRLGYAERDRQVFNWRMRRLVRHGLLQTRSIPYLAPEPIYSITRAGALAFESHGELPFASWGYERSASDLQVPHTLELNRTIIPPAVMDELERGTAMGIDLPTIPAMPWVKIQRPEGLDKVPSATHLVERKKWSL